MPRALDHGVLRGGDQREVLPRGLDWHDGIEVRLAGGDERRARTARSLP